MPSVVSSRVGLPPSDGRALPEATVMLDPEVLTVMPEPATIDGVPVMPLMLDTGNTKSVTSAITWL